MNGRVLALILAVIVLVCGVVVRLRARRDSKGAPLHSATLLIPCAIIIGTLPWVLGLSETLKNIGSAASIAVSIGAMVLLIRQMAHRPKA
jgi:hypothetical protein